MKLDVRPYIPYCLGRECKTFAFGDQQIETPIIVGIEKYLEQVFVELSNGRLLQSFEIKPIFRKLSSMNEEEKLELFKILYGEDSFSAMRLDFNVRLESLSADAFHYLLQKGFWLFGEEYFTEGLIIEKS